MRAWQPSSIPRLLLEERSVEDAAESKADLAWYGPRGSLHEWDLDPTLERSKGDDHLAMFEWFLSEREVTDWSGLVHSLPPDQVDRSEAQFLEFWFNDGIPYERRDQRTGFLHFDFGAVNEDALWSRRDPFQNPAVRPVVLPNGLLDDEDADNDGIFDAATEDTGLDGLSGAEDGDEFDDYMAWEYREDYSPRDFRFANGAEGNGRHDSEDLDGDGELDESDSYFGVQVDLSDPDLWVVDVRRDYVLREPEAPVQYAVPDTSGWRLIRVPLSDTGRVREYKSDDAPQPSWDSIHHVRLWITGVDGPRVVQLANLRM